MISYVPIPVEQATVTMFIFHVNRWRAKEWLSYSFVHPISIPQTSTIFS